MTQTSGVSLQRVGLLIAMDAVNGPCWRPAIGGALRPYQATKPCGDECAPSRKPQLSINSQPRAAPCEEGLVRLAAPRWAPPSPCPSAKRARSSYVPEDLLQP